MATQAKQLSTQDKIDIPDKCKRAALGLGWRHAFFLPIIGRVEFKTADWIPTACVDLRGTIYINPQFYATLDVDTLKGTIAHELCHLLLLHHDRRGTRKPFRWNKASDRAINSTLRKVGIQLPKGVLYAEAGQEDFTSEQLYEIEPEVPEDGYDPTQPSVGQGCGPMNPGDGPKGDKDGQGNEGDSGMSGEEESAARRQWREISAQCKNMGKSAGSGAGNALADLVTEPPAKVRWPQVLRGSLSRALAEAGRDDASWIRRSRRSTETIILPGQVTYKCQAAVVIDTSGSMSDSDLNQCVSEVAAVVNHLRVPIFLVVHDWVVQSATWVRPGSKANVVAQVRKNIKGRGGTCFDEAYKRVGQEGKFNVMIHLTDGEVGGWPEKPANVKRMVVALLGSKYKGAVPEGARVIDVEL